ncbi:hypothetical protein UFOVP363_4 [uncultured Caudovirales phage]|uniref:Gp6 domain containing protein n=1 Tax=uncultured Caudovirales phage TaxID=2100421 RepID=A0A6J7WVU3_9CAUD|nr:hypothetical protein UFOVP363_4 [uncultured Caudovirales phage]
MAVFTVTHAQRVDDYAVIQTLETTDITVGQSITVAGVGNDFDATYIVQAIPTYYFIGVDSQGDFEYNYEITLTNQLLVKSDFSDYQRSAATGTVTWTQSCTWTTVALVTEFLGIASATANDTAFLTTCVSASNAWCFSRRVQAGYKDSLSTSPSAAVTLGATLYAAGLYRERGTTGDSYASFSDMGGAPLMTLGRVNQLLGVKRSQVA